MLTKLVTVEAEIKCTHTCSSDKTNVYKPLANQDVTVSLRNGFVHE